MVNPPYASSVFSGLDYAYPQTTWYVSSLNGNDSNSGKSPSSPLATVTEAISRASAGDRILVGVGTYNEAVNLNKKGLQLIAEQGAFFYNSTPGTVITVYSNDCVVKGVRAEQTDHIAFDVRGSNVRLEDCLTHESGYGFYIRGGLVVIVRCAAFDSTTGFYLQGGSIIAFQCRTEACTTGFYVDSSSSLYEDCTALGDGDEDTCRGWYLTARARNNIFINCASADNQTAGWEATPGSYLNAFIRCSSGGTDGARVDNGSNNTWIEFGEQSQIGTGNSPAQDRKDIYDLILTSSACDFHGEYPQKTWYVSADYGSDTNSGESPDQAFQTVTKAITSANAGDRILVGKGTYNGTVDLNKDGLKLVAERGATFTNTGGYVFTVSGDNCVVIGVQSNQGTSYLYNFVVTGNDVRIEDCVAQNGGRGFDIRGQRVTVLRCRTINAGIGFSLQGSNGHYEDCVSIGDGASSSGGWCIWGGSSYNTLINCSSADNTTNSWVVYMNADYNTFVRCSSGGNDGSRADAGSNNTWIEFGEKSLISTGNSPAQDRKVLYDRTTTVSGNTEVSGQDIYTDFKTILTLSPTDALRATGITVYMNHATKPPTNGATLTFRWRKTSPSGTTIVYGDTWTWVVGTDGDAMPVADVVTSRQMTLEVKSDNSGDTDVAFYVDVETQETR